nr:DUF4198 domain-containing protein [uncultured Carboxylicivirga sp.]
MKKVVLLVLLLGVFNTLIVDAHVPFLKPNQFIILHNRLQIESSFTEFPFQADFAMVAPFYTMFGPEGEEIVEPTAKTRAACYLEPVISGEGTYRIHAALRKGPKYKAIETADGKLYFSDEIKKHEGTLTSLQYYSSADTYLKKGKANYKTHLVGNGVEIIPLSSPNEMISNQQTKFKVYHDGIPVANARIVVVYNNEHYEQKRIEDLYDVEDIRESTIYANEEGVFTFTPKKAGLVLLFVTIHKKIDNTLWESYNTSLTLEVHLSE